MICIPVKEDVFICHSDILQSPMGNFYSVVDCDDTLNTIKLNPLNLDVENMQFEIHKNVLTKNGWLKKI